MINCHHFFLFNPKKVNRKHPNGWMRKTAIRWARFGDCNACIVDWSHLASFDYSTASDKHIKLVAKYILKFAAFLTPNGMDIEKTSIAGHSLGAQIAGHVGTLFKGKVGAIYGIYHFCHKNHLIHLTLHSLLKSNFQA